MAAGLEVTIDRDARTPARDDLIAASGRVVKGRALMKPGRVERSGARSMTLRRADITWFQLILLFDSQPSAHWI